MRTLVLVRHGETVGNSSIRYYGRTDVELSEAGRSQMRAARRWLKRRFGSAGFALAIASPLRRAMEGAAIIADAAHPIIEIKEFVEVDFGDFEGLTADEIRERYPADFKRWNRNRLDPGFAYPGGESRADFAYRVECGIQRILEVVDGTWAMEAGGTGDEEDGGGACGDVTLVVAHRGVIRIIANRLAGAEPAIELGSIQILQRDGLADAWRVDAIDIVEHLADLD
jgi:broad specificity phosphatase PhoE